VAENAATLNSCYLYAIVAENSAAAEKFSRKNCPTYSEVAENI